MSFEQICKYCQGTQVLQAADADGSNFREEQCPYCNEVGLMREPTFNLPGTTDVNGAMDKAVEALEASLEREAAKKVVHNNPTTLLNMLKQVLEGDRTQADFWADVYELRDREKKHLRRGA